ncbi:phage protease [Methylobacter sp. Wu1]|uniref:phage protease n=1 Tax=Methylobacter sp. Wu1 TaxID=3119359 RepID=UPI002F9486F5
MSKRPHPTIALSARLIELDGAAPTEFRLLPVGQFKAKDGRPQGLPGWVMNDANAAAILSAASAQQDKFLIDYDHQTLHSKTNGQPAPAAGWFGRMEWRPGDGLFATDIEWTAAARAAIETKEYRYISPVLKYDPKTGDVTGVIMAALVNYAALDGLTDLAAAAALLFSSTQDSDMDELLERLRYLLNLPITATADDIAAELDKLKAMIAQPDGSTAGLSALLAAKDGEIAALSAQVDTATATHPDPALYAPIAVVNEMRSRLAALSATTVEDQVAKLIEDGVAKGKIIGEAEKAWATALGKKDIASLQGYLDSAQPIAALAGMQTVGMEPLKTGSSLTDDELAVCSAIGVDPEEYKKTKEANS